MANVLKFVQLILLCLAVFSSQSTPDNFVAYKRTFFVMFELYVLVKHLL